jgi:hypothetical protein
LEDSIQATPLVVEDLVLELGLVSLVVLHVPECVTQMVQFGFKMHQLNKCLLIVLHQCGRMGVVAA